MTMDFFRNILHVARSKNIEPNRWCSADETMVAEEKKASVRVVVGSDQSNDQLNSGDFFKEHLTLMVGSTSEGHLLCPMLIFKVAVSLLRVNLMLLRVRRFRRG